MTLLSQQRCFNHSRREAAARCVECGRFFCRECVTEHDRRVICSKCLERKTATPAAARTWRMKIWRGVGVVVSVALLWAMVYLMAQMLLAVPDDFHEGRVWRVENWNLD